MVDPATILAGFGVAKGLFRRKRRPNISTAIADLRAARPTGYLTDADLRAAELAKGRLAADVRAQGDLSGAMVRRRMVARGLAGSPSEERDLARVNQQTLLGVQNAGDYAEQQLYGTQMGREGFERQKALDIFGAQIGDTQREQQRWDAQQGAFWNSLNEFVPAIMSYLPSDSGYRTTEVTPAGGYNPGAGGPDSIGGPRRPGQVPNNIP